jgi:dihydrofolate synthase/folylpolyglutamate synthase
MHDKDIRQCLGQIVPVADVVIYTRPVYSRAADPTLLSQEAEPLHRPGEVINNLSEALDRARAIASPRDLILVTGSLFTVGEALTYFDPETHRPDDVQ